jgi:hypothetical protein
MSLMLVLGSTALEVAANTARLHNWQGGAQQVYCTTSTFKRSFGRPSQRSHVKHVCYSFAL